MGKSMIFAVFLIILLNLNAANAVSYRMTNQVQPPACSANLEEYEIVILIAQFEEISPSQISAHLEWQTLLQEALEGLNNDINVRIVLLKDTVIRSHEEAHQYSDECLATLVIWGTTSTEHTVTALTSSVRWEPSNNRLLPVSLDVSNIRIPSFQRNRAYLVNFLAGLLAYLQNDFDAARNLLEEAVIYGAAESEQDSGLAVVHFYLGHIHHVLQVDLLSARSHFDQAISLRTDFWEAYFWRGNFYLRNGDLAAALSDLNDVIRLNPENVAAYNNRGSVYARQGNLNRAIEDYNQAIILDPENASYYHDRGTLFMRQGNFEAAITDFNTAINLAPADANFYVSRGVAYFQLREVLSALADFDEAIELDPQNAEAYSFRGSLRIEQGSYSRAISDISRAIELNPANAANFYNRGLAHYQQGNFRAAISDFDRAVRLFPQYAAAYLMLGSSYDSIGSYKVALTYYWRYLDLAGTEPIPSVVERVRYLQSQGFGDE